MPQNTHPLGCEKIIDDKNACPVSIPCECHEEGVDAGVDFLRNFIKSLLIPEDGLAVSYVIPCDASDTWIVAAFDEYEDYEVLHDPWQHIIASAPYYHGIKIKNRPHKAKSTYEELISTVCEKWSMVIEKCPQAKKFDEDVKRFLIDAELSQ